MFVNYALLPFLPSETILNVDEVVGANRQRRLVFDGTEEYHQPFVFKGVGEETCKNIIVTIPVCVVINQLLCAQCL